MYCLLSTYTLVPWFLACACMPCWYRYVHTWLHAPTIKQPLDYSVRREDAGSLAGHANTGRTAADQCFWQEQVVPTELLYAHSTIAHA